MITIYSTPNCVNCNSLKQLYKANDVTFEEKTIGKDVTREELEKLSGVELKSAPVVFRDAVYIGGIGEAMLLINEERTKKTQEIQAQMADELKALGISL